jgi:ribosomal protein L37E
MSECKNGDIIIIRCSRCNHILYHKHKKFVDLTGLPEEMKEQLKSVDIDKLLGIVKQPVEIKCRHKDQGKKCDMINLINL